MLRARYVKRLVRSRVIAHTTDGQSIRGVLTGEHRDCIVPEPAEFLKEAAEPESINGRAVILRDKLGWLQVLGDDRP